MVRIHSAIMAFVVGAMAAIGTRLSADEAGQNPNPAEVAHTVVGLVRNARTRTPIEGMVIVVTNRNGRTADGVTDREGRFRIVRNDERGPIWVQAIPYLDDRYVGAARKFPADGGPGQIVADFDLLPGVLVRGRVREAHTDRPIVSHPRFDCNAPGARGAPLAGYVFYFPLATNRAIADTPTELFFQYPPWNTNRYLAGKIDGEGRFALAVPPGPGILLVQARPGAAEEEFYKAGELYRLFPYGTLATRVRDDGAPGERLDSFPGLCGPIPLATPLENARAVLPTHHHAYQIINPPADAEVFDTTLRVSRAASRTIRWLDSQGQPPRDLNVQGLLAAPRTFPIPIARGEAEVMALEPGKTREVIAISPDATLVARTLVSAHDPPAPRTIQLEPAGTITGRLLDDDGKPLANYEVGLTRADEHVFVPKTERVVAGPVKTDADGRFTIPGVIPSLSGTLTFQQYQGVGMWFVDPERVYQPDALRSVVVQSGEIRALGEIQLRR